MGSCGQERTKNDAVVLSQFAFFLFTSQFVSTAGFMAA